MEEIEDVMVIVERQVSKRFRNVTKEDMKIYIDKILLEMKKSSVVV